MSASLEAVLDGIDTWSLVVRAHHRVFASGARSIRELQEPLERATILPQPALSAALADIDAAVGTPEPSPPPRAAPSGAAVLDALADVAREESLLTDREGRRKRFAAAGLKASWERIILLLADIRDAWGGFRAQLASVAAVTVHVSARWNADTQLLVSGPLVSTDQPAAFARARNAIEEQMERQRAALSLSVRVIEIVATVISAVANPLKALRLLAASLRELFDAVRDHHRR